MSTRSLDSGISWTTPGVILGVPSSSSRNDAYSIDYGGNYLYIALQASQSPRVISYVSSSNFGSSWSPMIKLTSTDDSYQPTVAARESEVQIAYTRNYANSGDLDVWYAYLVNTYNSASQGYVHVITTSASTGGYPIGYAIPIGSAYNAKWPTITVNRNGWDHYARVAWLYPNSTYGQVQYISKFIYTIIR